MDSDDFDDLLQRLVWIAIIVAVLYTCGNVRCHLTITQTENQTEGETK